MSDDQVGCEWVSVSSGTGLPGLSRTKDVKRLCVCVCSSTVNSEISGADKQTKRWEFRGAPVCIYNSYCLFAVMCGELQQQQQQPFNGRLSGTTRVDRYQKKHSPAHTHPGQRTSFITFLHLQRSMASSLFSLRA